MDQQDETEGRVKVPRDDASGNPEGEDTEGYLRRRRTEDAPTTTEGEDTEGYGTIKPRLQ